MKRILNTHFDLHGLEISRVGKIAFIGKILPLGNLRGGPGVRCLLILGLLHFFGYPIFLILARIGEHSSILRRISAKLRA